MNIVDQILFHCRYQPPAAAICAPGKGIGLISYGRLERFVHNITRRAMRIGLAKGDIAAINVEDPIFEAAITLAFIRIGVVTYYIRGRQLPLDFRTHAIITDTPLPTAITGRIILVDLSWTEGDGIAPDLSEAVGAEDGCRLILTSGTTGNPRAVVLSHKLLLARIARHQTVFGPRLGPCSRILSDLSLATSLGFQFLVYTLCRGGIFFLPGSDVETTFDSMEKFNVQALVCSPSGMMNMLTHYDAYSFYQSSLDVVICAGDVLAKSLSDRARARVSSNLVSVYGSTEASMTATAPAQALARLHGSVGYIAPGIEVEICDHSDRPLPCNSEGMIRVRSDFAVASYFGNPAESQQAFRDGWFYPGDIGTLTTDKILTISGRQKTLLNVGGDKINPERIEEVLLGFDGIVQAAAHGIPNELGIELVHALIVASTKVDFQRLHGHCLNHLPGVFVPTHFVRVNDIPRNEMGKIDRQRLASLARAGSIVAVAEWTVGAAADGPAN
jgi:acyl-coenzyme A synthetase/AMP-(fatty) acid ligase